MQPVCPNPKCEAPASHFTVTLQAFAMAGVAVIVHCSVCGHVIGILPKKD